MSFKYINPGYLDLLQNIDTSYAGSQTPTSSQSKSGTAFWVYSAPSYGYLKTIDQQTSGKEIWAKFDCYFPTSREYCVRLGTTVNYIEITYSSGTYKTGYRVWSGSASTTYLASTSNSNDVEKVVGVRLQQINTIWMHLKIGSGDEGLLEWKINNKYFSVSQGTVYSSTSSYFGLINYISKPSAMETFFSNVIISDEYISPYERVVPLIVSNTVTDMETLESGLYVADNASETLLQSVNTTSLVNEYGSDAQVTGIALIGNPAYEVDDVIGSLTSITKQNGVVTDHDNITLLTDSDAMIVSSFSLPTDTTVADLANYQFGWRTED